MTRTEPIEIPIEGDARDFIADAKKVQEQMDILAHRLDKAGVSQAAYNKAVANARGAASGQVDAVRQSSISLTDIRSAYMMAADAARVAGQVWDETAGKLIDYAANVRDVSRSLGSSTEEASRLIQVADDVGVSYSSLTTSLKMAQKDGIDPSIDGLAKLSDQYLALAPGVERTKFLLENFGKSGADMGKLMEQGGAGIREMSESIDESMILTQEAVDQAREFEIAQDAMNDTWDAFTYKVAPPLMNAMTDVINHYRDIATSLEENGYWYTLTHQLSLDDIAAKREQSDAAMLAADGNNELSVAQEDNASAVDAQKEAVQAAEDALKAYKDELEAVSQANQDAESFIQSYADFSKNYAEQHAEAVQRLTEATAEGSAESIADAQSELQKLEASWHESTQAMIYDMVLTKVSLGGLTDAEFKATQDLAVSMGIRTQAQADEAKAAMDKANSIVDGIAMQEDVMKEKANADAELLALEDAKAAAAAGTTEVVVNGNMQGVSSEQALAQSVDSATLSIIRQGQEAERTAAKVASIKSSGSSGSSSGGIGNTGGGSDNNPKTPWANGGSFIIPMSYGNEGFRMGNNDTASGGEKVTITRRGESEKTGGNIYNITINNPKRETAEETMRSMLQSLAYTGVPA